jgi:site-specific recombinase XerD
VRTYTTPLRHLGRWLERENITRPTLLDRQVLHRWQDELAQEVGPKSQAVYAGAVRGLLRWAAREDRLQPGLADFVEAPEVPDHEPLVLEPEQLQAAVGWYQAPDGDLEYLRDRALFWFLVTSSARISEALRLNLADVDRHRWIVIQKGGGQKALIISAVARQWLERYLRARGKDGEPALWIYLGPIVGRRRLTRADTNRIWKRLCAELGIPRFTSRWLRGTSATELNELDATPIDIAHHLGHRNLATVMKYAKLRDRRRRAMVDQLDQLIPPTPASTPRRRGRRRPA